MRSIEKYSTHSWLVILLVLSPWICSFSQTQTWTFDHAKLQSVNIGTASAWAINTANQEVEVDARKLTFTLDLGEVYPLGKLNWSSHLELEVIAQDQSNNTLHTFVFEFDPFDTDAGLGEPEKTIDLDYKPLGNGLHHFVLKANAFSISANGNANVEALVEEHIRLKVESSNLVRCGTRTAPNGGYILPNNLSVQGLHESQTDGPTGRPVRAKFSWSLPGSGQKFPSYDLEVVKLEPEGITQSVPVNWKEAIRIEVDGSQEYTMTLAEGTGYYAWRVRGIGNLHEGGRSNRDNYGFWNLPSFQIVSGALTSHHFTLGPGPYDLSTSGNPVNPLTTAPLQTQVFHYEQFDEELNWQYATAFTEGSRQSEGMVYANGLNEVVQSQGKLSSQHNVQSTQMVRDYSGRDALQTIPVPIQKEHLAFEPHLFEKGSGNAASWYGPEDFDLDSKLFTNTTLPLDNKVNAYFSDANHGALMDSYIPDAEGKPYARTLYDAEGRLYLQSFAGDTLQLKDPFDPNNHNIQYQYGSSSQEELDRVFGSEAPLANTVFKSQVKDANGVIHVSYLSKSGETLASCINNDGQSDNLLEISDVPELPFTVTDVFDPGRISPSSNHSETSKRLIVNGVLDSDNNPTTPKEKQIAFDYSITPKAMSSGCGICWTCDYRIELEITSPQYPTDPERNAKLTVFIEPQDLAPACTFTGSALTLADLTAASTTTLTGPTNSVAPRFSSLSSGGPILLQTGTYVIQKRVYVNTKDVATGKQQFDLLVEQLRTQYNSWNATENCCGPINVDLSGWSCDEAPDLACNSQELLDLAAHWHTEFISRELNASLSNSLTYTDQLTASGNNLLSVQYANLSSFQALILSLCSQGYGSNMLNSCFEVFGNVLEMNIATGSQIAQGNGGALGAGNPSLNFDADMDLLQGVFDCIGYDPNAAQCSSFKDIVTWPAASTASHYIALWHTGLSTNEPTNPASISNGGSVLYVQIQEPGAPSSAQSIVEQDMCAQAWSYPNSFTTGLSQAQAMEVLAENLCGCVRAANSSPSQTSNPSATTLDMVDLCVDRCEANSLSFQTAVNGYVLDQNEAEGIYSDETDPSNGFSIWDPTGTKHWEPLDELINEDMNCIVDAMTAQCVSQCQLSNTLQAGVWLNAGTCLCGDGQDCFTDPNQGVWDCAEDYINSPAFAALMQSEQTAYEQAMLHTADFLPAAPNPQVNGYSNIPTAEIAQQELVQFFYESLDLNMLLRQASTPLTATTPQASWFNPTGTDVHYSQQTRDIPVPTASGNRLVTAVTNVVWDAGTDLTSKTDDQILEVNLALYCNQGGNPLTNVLFHWAYSPTNTCGNFAPLNPLGFSIQSQVAELWFDELGAFHAVLQNNACDANLPGVIDYAGVCSSPALASWTIDVLNGAPGANILLEIGNANDGLTYLYPTPEDWDTNPSNTASNIAETINNRVTTPNFYAEANGTTVTIYTAHGTDGDPSNWDLYPSGTITTTAGPIAASACGVSLSNLASSCSHTEAEDNTQPCPYGYFLTSPTQALANGGYVLPQDASILGDNIIDFWTTALSNIIVNRPVSNQPRWELPGHPSGINGWAYYEDHKLFFTNGGNGHFAYVSVLGQETAGTAGLVKELYTITLGISCQNDPSSKAMEYTLYAGDLAGGNLLPIYSQFNIDPANPNTSFNPLTFAGATPVIFNGISLIHQTSIGYTHFDFDLNQQSAIGGGQNTPEVAGFGYTTQVPSGLNGTGLPTIEMWFNGTSSCESGVECEICMRWDQPLPVLPQAVEVLSCEEEQQLFVNSQVRSQLEQCFNQQVIALKESYRDQCLGSVEDALSMTYELNMGQYTLYYYDRAGNLISTVPPEGVELLTQAEIDAVQDFRNSVLGSNHVATQHRLKTTYDFNSIQATQSTTPDGGKTSLWYNANGFQVLSADAEMRAEDVYNYKKFDALGRLIEAGSIHDWSPTFDQNNRDIVEELWLHPEFPDNLTTATLLNRSFLQYSIADPTVNYAGQAQQHLRNRVSKTWTDDGFASWFSYDPHGNMEWMIEEWPDLGRKTIRKEYELISGNVNQVIYMEGTTEQFMHRMEYDEDNRMTALFTSTDGITWDRDEAVAYYSDGNLARHEIGEDHIQGVDYVHTINGWVKAINQPGLQTDGLLDPGKDGSWVGKIPVPSSVSGTVSSIKIDGVAVLGIAVNEHADGAEATAREIVTSINQLHATNPQTYPYTASSGAGATSTITIYGPAPAGAGKITIGGTMGLVAEGNMNLHQGYVKDEFAMELGYFDGDYNRTGSYLGASVDATGSQTAAYPYQAAHNSTLPGVQDHELYNGNIAYWQANTRAGHVADGSFRSMPNGHTRFFTYDKLNRLREANHSTFDGQSYAAKKNREYDESFTYDRNGNILSVLRHGSKNDPNDPSMPALPNSNGNQIMDELIYAYERDANNKLLTNKLKYLDEVAAAYGSDLGDQDPGNYQYDAAGRLIRDEIEGLIIEWNYAVNKPALIKKMDDTGLLMEAIHFEYDEGGNRKLKMVTNSSGQILKVFYYVFGGQVLYERQWDGTLTTLRMSELTINPAQRVGLYKPFLKLLEHSGYLHSITPVTPSPLNNKTLIPYVPNLGNGKGGGGL